MEPSLLQPRGGRLCLQQDFSFEPNSGYMVDSVDVDGSSVGSNIISYTFNNINANHSLNVSFTPIPGYIITASTDGNGTIDPSGAVYVTSGSNQTFTITPNSGYAIAGVYVDESLVVTNATYTFTNVTAAHSINATFVQTDTASIGSTYYSTVQAAYNAASNGDTIKVTAKTITENLNINRNISVNLEGGYDKTHTNITGTTTLKGMIQTFSGGGTLTIKNFIITTRSQLKFIYKTLLHMDGTNGSTTFRDSSIGAKTVTAVGNAQISTAQMQFGTASGLFDGSGDYLTVPDSDDWYFGTGDFTIDVWLKAGLGGTCGLVEQYVDANNYWYFSYESQYLYFHCKSGGTTLVSYSWYSVNPLNLCHIEICRTGTTMEAFRNGTKLTKTETTAIGSNSIPNFATTLNIGTKLGSAGSGITDNKRIDELRISKGIARHTANFTPPTAAY